MSGLCGIVHFDGIEANPRDVEPMANVVAHRGPDGIKQFDDGQAALCHLKLNVYRRDLLDNQPLVGNDGVVVLSDSRLDNRSELCAELGVGLDDADDSPADSTLILAAYQKWGTECAEHLLGDFAFAIWDPTRNQVYAARDAMGMRAFYYRSEEGRFLFGTEVKQILEAPEVRCEINEQSVAAHLVGYFGNLSSTFYLGIDQLVPAHAMVVNSDGVKTWRYWDVRPEDHVHFDDPLEYENRFRELFLESVACRTRHALSPGIMLSGGLDSGSIASAAAWLKKEDGPTKDPQIRTYSWAFNSVPECDERHLSRLVTDYYEIPVTEINTDNAWPLHHYPSVGPDRDEPSIGAYEDLEFDSLSTASTDGVKMMIWGFRGDLLVGGWVFDYFYLMRRRWWRALRNELRTHAKLESSSTAKVILTYLLWPAVGKIARAVRRGNIFNRRRSRPELTNQDWVSPGLRKMAVPENQISIPVHLSRLTQRQRYSLIFTPMHMRVAIWSERNCAMHGMSFCDPWSDRRLAKFCLSIPQQLLDTPGEVEKNFIRRSLADVLPPAFSEQARKIVPTTYFRKALREWSQPVITDLLSKMEAEHRKYVLSPHLMAHYDSIKAGTAESGTFWWVLTLEMWLRAYWRGS